MATSREERMQQRLRGAQRHQVEDISFGPIFPVEEEVPVEEPVLENEAGPELAGSPALGTERRPPSPETEIREPEDLQAAETPGRPQRRPAAAGTSSSVVRSGPYELPENTDEEAVRGSNRSRAEKRSLQSRSGYEEVTESPADAPGSGHRRRVRISAAASQSATLQQILSAQSDLGPAAPSSSPLERKTRKARASAAAESRLSSKAEPSLTGARLSTRLSQASAATREIEIEESSPALAGEPDAASFSIPADADNVDELSPNNTATASSVTQSSPLARTLRNRRASAGITTKTQNSKAGSRAAGPLRSDADVDELSPKTSAAQTRLRKAGSRAEKSPRDDADAITPSTAPSGVPGASLNRHTADSIRSGPTREKVTEIEVSAPSKSGNAAPEIEDPDDESHDEAEEADDQEAGRQLGRKRLPRSLHAPSPELGSAAEESGPRPTKRRRTAPVSGATRQTQSSKASRTATMQQPERRRTMNTAAPPRPDGSQEADASGQPISVPVQRFTKFKGPGGEETDEDELVSGIPYTTRDGVTSLDILRQLCEEVTAGVLRTLKEKVSEAEDLTSRRDLTAKIRALEAFREELRTKLIEHTIALDSLHILKKRLRASLKEKRDLRDEVLRLRAERDQVALRMDALRMKHNSEAQKVLRNIQISSAMHDIELAAEQARSAPEPSAAECKRAELANLELLMDKVGEQVCADGQGTGVLNQVKSFNAYLERAAAALQAR